ncbi:MAG: hypothetical protein WCT08_05255 [Patescibacteria group bacterium]|jgi:rubrerythrin
MTSNTPKTKTQIIQEFQEMRGLEESTCGFYKTIALSPEIQDEEVKEIFKIIKDDEHKHAQIIDEILRIVKNNL